MPALPLSILAPAAAASLAYLNARFLLSHDYRLVAALISTALNARRLDGQDRVNYFYRLEEFALSRKDANRTWLIYEGQSWTYKEGYDIVLQYATWLKTTYAIASGEIVGVDFMNSEKFIFLTMALWSLGAKPALINYNLTSKPLLHCIKTSTARLVVVDEEVRSKFDTDVMGALASADFRDGGKGSVEVVIFEPALEKKVLSVAGVREPDSCRSGAAIQGSDKIAALMYTSGTTGLPKPAIVGWHKIYTAAALNKHWMGLKKSDVYYTCMPLYHGTATILAYGPSFVIGNTLSIGHRFSNKTFWPDVRASKATVIQYVGETCRYLLAAPALLDPSTGENLDKKNNVRIAFGNGLRPDVWERFKDRFGIETIAEFYSATEGPSASWNLSRNSFSTGAIGRAGTALRAITSSKMAIVELDWEADLPVRDPKNNNFCSRTQTNEPGELIYWLDPQDIAASYQGYFGNEKASTSKILRDVFAKGDAWFRTGDAVRMDAQGRLFFCDRIGDTYRWHSENVSTNEVSEVLGTHPAISEANVYGVELPHHDGRAGCVAITFNQEPNRQTLKDLAGYVQARLPKFAVPLFLRLVTEAHTTGNNKQQKHGLRMQGVNPEALLEGEKLLWLKNGTYEAFGDTEWEQLRAGQIKL